MKIRKVDCPYCRVPLKYVATKKIQLGQSGLIFEHLSQWLSGALPVSIYECPVCGKFEFFRSNKQKANEKKKEIEKKDDSTIDI